MAVAALNVKRDCLAQTEIGVFEPSSPAGSRTCISETIIFDPLSIMFSWDRNSLPLSGSFQSHQRAGVPDVMWPSRVKGKTSDTALSRPLTQILDH